MELKKKNIFLINSNFLRKIIKQISETKLEKKLSSNQIEIVNKILVKKVTNLNELFFRNIYAYPDLELVKFIQIKCLLFI